MNIFLHEFKRPVRLASMPIGVWIEVEPDASKWHGAARAKGLKIKTIKTDDGKLLIQRLK